MGVWWQHFSQKNPPFLPASVVVKSLSDIMKRAFTQDVTAAGSHDVCLFLRSHICQAVTCANVVVLFQLLGVNGTVLTEALTHKKIIAKGEEVGLETHSHCSVSV